MASRETILIRSKSLVSRETILAVTFAQAADALSCATCQAA
jgi:hypothetical protein